MSVGSFPLTVPGKGQQVPDNLSSADSFFIIISRSALISGGISFSIINSEMPIIPVSGLFSSCARPEASSPMDASRPLIMSCWCMFLSSSSALLCSLMSRILHWITFCWSTHKHYCKLYRHLPAGYSFQRQVRITDIFFCFNCSKVSALAMTSFKNPNSQICFSKSCCCDKPISQSRTNLYLR